MPLAFLGRGVMPLCFLLLRLFRLPVDFGFVTFDFFARAIISPPCCRSFLGAALRNQDRFNAALPAENSEHE
jgi:hypothetical protein